MNQIFMIYPEAYNECAKQVMNGLTNAGYPLWENWEEIKPDNPLYSQTFRRGIMGADAVILLWGKEAIGHEFIEWQFLVAQQLKKPIFPVQLDDEQLPSTLVKYDSIKTELDCSNVVDSLLLHLPAPDYTYDLSAVFPQITNKYIRERRAGIERIDQILEKDGDDPITYEEELLAALEMIAIHDPIGNMRRLAKTVLEKHHEEHSRPSFAPDESRHMIGVRCINNHVTWFDKREICPASGTIKRLTVRRADQEFDELSLECGYCDETTVVTVDCEGYK